MFSVPACVAVLCYLIRVPLDRHLLICLLDLILRRILSDAESRVVILTHDGEDRSVLKVRCVSFCVLCRSVWDRLLIWVGERRSQDIRLKKRERRRENLLKMSHTRYDTGVLLMLLLIECVLDCSCLCVG